LIFTQGAALGWYVAALSGLRKTISDFMRSVFYSPAILVTLKCNHIAKPFFIIAFISAILYKYYTRRFNWSRSLKGLSRKIQQMFSL